MFVDIENPKSVLAIENLLIPYKRGRVAPDKKSYLPKELITSDICWEVLRSTNTPRSIKNMLSCIAELPSSEQSQFKDVVLATFSNREQPNDILVLGKKLAHVSNYEAEFTDAQKLKEGKFIFSSLSPSFGLVTQQNSFADENLSAYLKVICLTHEEVKLKENVKFPKILEFPNSSSVLFSHCNLIDVERIRFRENADVKFHWMKNFPADMELSHCASVYFNSCVVPDNIRLCDKVTFMSMRKIPENCDFSHCSYVDLSYSSLANLKNIRFKDNSTVILKGASDLPDNLDLSPCKIVNLTYTSIGHLKNLRFRDGAVVDLSNIVSCPDVLDISACSTVDFLNGNLPANVKKIIFKNKKQALSGHFIFPDNWKGKIRFKSDKVANVIEAMYEFSIKYDRF